MTEERDTEFYYEHRDDPEIWGEAEKPAEPKKRAGLGATITVRFSEEEAQDIRRLAKRTGQKYSDIVRKAVAHYLHPEFTVKEVSIQQTFGAAPDTRQLAEQIVLNKWNKHEETETTTTTHSQTSSKPSKVS